MARPGRSFWGHAVDRCRRSPIAIAVAASCLVAVLAGMPVVGAAPRSGAPSLELSDPIPDSSGKGQAAPNMPDDVADEYDYVEEEYFISGKATSYLPVGELATEGNWTVEPRSTVHDPHQAASTQRHRQLRWNRGR
jgi:hypothetical protein